MNRFLAIMPLFGGLAITLGLASFITLPALFPYSDGVFAALSAFFFTISIACYLPDNALHTPKERLVHAFKSKHGTSAQNAESALELINTALFQAQTLTGFMPYFSEKNKPAARELIDTLTDVASRIFDNPQNLRTWQASIHRGALVLEAAEAKAKIMRKRAAASYKEEAEAHMRKAIEAAQTAFNTAEKASADSVMINLDTAAQTAAEFAKG